MPAGLTHALKDRYRLERELGQGGTATVYLAEDLRHHRKVAVKVLRPDLAASLGPERFVLEIEVAARLQHPHILALHDSGEASGFLYYVMPYVEGASLRDRLTQSEFSVSEAVRILVDVVEAVAYAHGQGVVHRDLKPDNIMVAGRHPLIMDFGIAKAVSSATGASSVVTGGVALGTPAYMAPEQAVADPHVDHRADIYAIGVIGYELLTGSPPFTGMSVQGILAAHLVETPALISTRRASVPEALEAILMQCLAKLPGDRPQKAEEVLHVLEALVTPSGGRTPTKAQPRLNPSVANSPGSAWFLAGLVVLIAAAAGVTVWRGGAGASAGVRAHHSQLTFTGTADDGEISPDGHLLAYRDDSDATALLVKDLEGGTIIPVSRLRGFPHRWSPDGTSILTSYVDSSGFWIALIPRLGGAARPLSPLGKYVLMSPDKAQLAGWFVNGKLALMTLATKVTRRISVPDSLGWRGPGDWSPDGRALALVTSQLTGDRQFLSAVELETGVWRILLADTAHISAPRWSHSEQALYYLRGESELWKLPVTWNGVVRGAPILLQSDFGADGEVLSIAADDRKLIYAKAVDHSDLWLATRPKGARDFATRQLTHGSAGKGMGSISPDGRLIAYIAAEGAKNELILLPAAGGEARRVALSSGDYSGPVWSPDGTTLAYIANSTGVPRVHSISLDGLQERTFEETSPTSEGQIAWAPAKRILYMQPGNRNFIWLDPESQAEEPLVANDSVGWMLHPVISPDGQHVAVFWNRVVAVFWNRVPSPGLYSISVNDGKQLKLETGYDKRVLGWSQDSRFVFVADTAGAIRRVPLAGGGGATIGTMPFKNADCSLTDRPPEVVLLCDVFETTRDLWMMEDFDPSRAARH